MNPHPYCKVFIGFVFAPAIGGGILGLFPFIFNLSSAVDEFGLSGLWIIVPFTLVAALYGVLAFMVPSSLLAVVYALLKFQKNRKGYLLTTVMGGTGAALWGLLCPLGMPFSPRNWGRFSLALVFFSLGAISSLVMARLVLPEKEPVDWDELENTDVP